MKIKLDDGTLSYTALRRHIDGNVTRHDRVVVYVRQNRRKLRIRDWSSVEAFMAEYKALLDGPRDTPPVKAAAPNTLRWLVERYYASATWDEVLT